MAAAGYEVRFGVAEGADLVIHLDGDEVASDAGQRISLAKGDDGGVDVENYDRAALIKLVAGGKRERA